MIEQTFQLSGPAVLFVTLPAGSLVVESGPAGSATVSIDTERSDLWRVVGNGNTVTVTPERSGGFGRSGRARVRIVAPEGSSLHANTASADVRAGLDLDEVTIKTASGSVVLMDMSTADIKTASGDIRLKSVEGDLSVRSASGDLRVSQIDGAATITTASGDVAVETARDSLSSSSASGDLSVQRYLGDDIEASTMSGRIEVGLPSGIGVRLQASTLSGRVHLPDRRKSETSPDRQVSVRLKSVSGDLRIRRID